MRTTSQYVPLPVTPRATPSSISLVFTWLSGVHAVALREDRPLVVGRGAPSDVVLDEASLSRSHARFWLERGEVRFADLGSTNGTQLDGKAAASGALQVAGCVRLGSVDVRVAGYSSGSSEPALTSGFLARLEQELVRARFFGRGFALVALETTDERAAELPRHVRPVDVVEPYTTTLSLLLMPEVGAPQVQALVQNLRGSSLGVGRAGAVLHPSSASSAEVLLTECIGAARSATATGVQFAAPAASEPADQPIVVAANMRRVHGLVAAAARTTIPVLISGETGSGKESLACAVHEQSARRGKPFKAVNCAALPTSLIASALFGHERGAFTGADRQQAGLFEQSHTGTLFLDEIGELPLEAQAALLRVLETGRLVRVGGTKEVAVDVRVVAATHRDLAAMIAAGQFREDLLYRLDAFTVRVPPLRERPDEILPLARHFLAQSRARWSSRASELSDAVGQALVGYAWPGNVRQLRNVVERATTVCTSATIELDDLPDTLFDKGDWPITTASEVATSAQAGESMSLPDRLQHIEQQIIREALQKSRGNQAEAARALGVPRRTLTHKVHAYGLLADRAELVRGDKL